VFVFGRDVQCALSSGAARVPGHVERHRSQRCVTMMQRIDPRSGGGCELVEFGSEDAVYAAGAVAGQQVPPGVVPLSVPVFLGCRGLGGLDRAGGEAGLAEGDADPDVDGRDLAPAVPQVGYPLGCRGRQPGDEAVPGGLIDGPVLQGLAASLVIDQGRAGCAVWVPERCLTLRSGDMPDTIRSWSWMSWFPCVGVLWAFRRGGRCLPGRAAAGG
jgi:hypothetical protein